MAPIHWTIFKVYTVVLVVLVSGVHYISAIQGLRRNFGPGCVENGTSVTYDCTVVDDGPILLTTVWEGTAFDCPPDNDISLQHIRYNASGTDGTCGALSAMNMSVNGNEYTSRLTVMANRDLNSSTIRCTISGQILVDSDTFTVGVIPPPPGFISITFSHDSVPSFTVSWSPPSGTVVGGVGGYMFGVTGDNCGCMDMNVSADTTSVTCPGWTANDQTCSFEVRTLTQDCGFVSSTAVTGNVILAIPSTPTGLSVQPNYNVDGSTQYIDVEFTGVDAPPLGPTIDSTISYTVTFDGSPTSTFTTTTCNSTNNCTLRVGGSQLSPSDTYTVNVVASNIVGSGEPATFPSQVVTNIITQNIVRVVINVSASTVSCILGSSFPVTNNFVCSITYGPSPNNCDTFTDSSPSTTGRRGDTVTVILTQDVNSGDEFCYTVHLNHGSVLLAVVGTFSSRCDPLDLGTNPTSSDGSGMVTVVNGIVNYNGVTPGSVAQLTCNSDHNPESSSADRTCMSDGNWDGGMQACVPNLAGQDAQTIGIAVGVVVGGAFLFVVGALVGALCVLCCLSCCACLVNGLREGKCCYILMTVLLIFACGFGIGVFIAFCFVKDKKGKDDRVHLGRVESQDKRSPSPENVITHERAPDTGDMYAMVEKKKSTQPQPTGAIYQDPNTIEHETAPTGDVYAVVDKPKRKSKKDNQGEAPDVVPGNSDLTYADLEVTAAGRKKPTIRGQTQPGAVEAPVEYASVNY